MKTYTRVSFCLLLVAAFARLEQVLLLDERCGRLRPNQRYAARHHTQQGIYFHAGSITTATRGFKRRNGACQWSIAAGDRNRTERTDRSDVSATERFPWISRLMAVGSPAGDK
jgi:hypothetical protein